MTIESNNLNSHLSKTILDIPDFIRRRPTLELCISKLQRQPLRLILKFVSLTAKPITFLCEINQTLKGYCQLCA